MLPFSVADDTLPLLLQDRNMEVGIVSDSTSTRISHTSPQLCATPEFQVDSAADMHVCNDRSIMFDVFEVQRPLFLRGLDGERTAVYTLGPGSPSCHYW